MQAIAHSRIEMLRGVAGWGRQVRLAPPLRFCFVWCGGGASLFRRCPRLALRLQLNLRKQPLRHFRRRRERVERRGQRLTGLAAALPVQRTLVMEILSKVRHHVNVHVLYELLPIEIRRVITERIGHGDGNLLQPQEYKRDEGARCHREVPLAREEAVAGVADKQEGDNRLQLEHMEVGKRHRLLYEHHDLIATALEVARDHLEVFDVL
mmetsp:Transcript_35391/g.80323  ORF Transcript_35391/g.80323 Transcript_35391/m.80323 type:complete len:209 (+) Transcript_35391:170-796(+)